MVAVFPFAIMSTYFLSVLFTVSLVGFEVRAQAVSEPSALTTATDLAPKGKKSSGLKRTLLQATGMEQSAESINKSIDDTKGLLTETLPDLGLKLKKAKKAVSGKSEKAKVSKTEYEGLPMVKLYTKYGSGDREIIEEFYVLRGEKAPSPYVKEIFWYDQKNRRVSSAVIKEKENAVLLHGPYKRYQGGDLMEEGFYYAGMKDGRWEKYDGKFMLIDKTRWQRGFPAESRIAYYDSTHTKIKEVIPMEYGKVKGNYYAFYENGLPAEEGKYDNGVKVGRWTEYYPTNAVGRRRRKLTQYAADRWDTAFEPYVISEWDDRGKLTYERPKEKRVVADDEAEN